MECKEILMNSIQSRSQDEKNTASVALARSLGFEIKSQELVVGTNNKEQA